MNGPFRMPDLGEGLDEAEIVAIHVEEGDYVVADQPLISVETDKAVVEIPSPGSGRIARLAVTAGGKVKIGAVLVEFDDGGHRPSGSVVGDLPTDQAAPVKAVPAVRALAQRLGVDLSKLAGSGPGGAITSRDVETAAKPPALTGEPLSGVRLAMARTLDDAHRRVAAATISEDADVEAWAGGSDITTRLIRAIARAAAAEPALNAWYDDQALSRRVHDGVALGLAMDTADGLFVPVLRGVEALSASQLRVRLDQIKQQVRGRTLPPEDLRGATLTLSNYGIFGAGQTAALMVVPPQVAIIGCGRLLRRVVPVGDGVAVHRVLPLSLTFDHRPVTGGEAARFLAALIGDLQVPD